MATGRLNKHPSIVKSMNTVNTPVWPPHCSMTAKIVDISQSIPQTKNTIIPQMIGLILSSIIYEGPADI